MSEVILQSLKVGLWLEELHDKRVEVMRVHSHVLQKLDRRLKSIDISMLLEQYSKVIHSIKENINVINSVGSDKVKCRGQIEALQRCEQNLLTVSEKCLKLVATCESLDNDVYGDVTMECSLHAYDSLHQCTELQQLIDSKMETITNTMILLEDESSCLQQLQNISKSLGRNIIQDQEQVVENIVHSFALKANTVIERSTTIENETAR